MGSCCLCSGPVGLWFGARRGACGGGLWVDEIDDDNDDDDDDDLKLKKW